MADPGPSPDRLATLTTHKAFPRRRVASDETNEALHVPSRRSYTSPTSEARITSWIRDASPVSPSEQHSFLLPLTPPEDIAERQRTMGEGTPQEEESPVEKTYYLNPSQEASGSVTPVNQSNRSPPTPDLTPPRKIRERKRSPSPPLRRRKRTSLSPPPTSRQTSSKAESFRTAAERLSPSPQSESAISKDPVPVFVFHGTSPAGKGAARPSKVDSIGLGIGMADDDNLRTPTNDRPMTFYERVYSSKDPTAKHVDSDPVVASEASAVRELSLKSDLLRPDLDADVLKGFSYINDDDTPYRERPFFQDSDVSARELSRSDLGSAHSVSPLSEHFEDDDNLRDQAQVDSKRVSQVSTFSTPQSVEVMIIESMPKQEHKLRHASKKSSLRAASSSRGDSNRSSLRSSVDYRPRLNGMYGRLANATADSSLYSDSGVSMVGSDHIMKRWSRLAATDIPRRQPSATQSLQFNTSPKFSSPPALRTTDRPATAPSGEDGSPGLRRTNRRSVSDESKGPQNHGHRRGRQLKSMLPPAIPTRTSSLGAASREPSGSSSDSSQAEPAAARNNTHSRTVSQPLQSTRPKADLSAIGASKHRRQMSEQTAISKQPLTPVITLSPIGPDDVASPTMPLWLRRSSEISEQQSPVTGSGTPRRSSKEDAALLASRALLKTPFSGHSVQSAFSGTYEVHEATAINIYPHTNSSLLVVQQDTPSTVNFPAHPGVRPGAYRVPEITSPTASERARQPESMHVKIEGPGGSPPRVSGVFADSPTLPYDSPLRNPRPAPKAPSSESGTLPSVKLIPPTPLDMPVTSGQPGSSGKGAILSGPVSLVRRALSSGTRTSAGATPRNSGSWLTSGRKKTSGGIQKRRSRPMLKDNNLSPFWRPKKFWDDEDEYNNGSVPETDEDAHVNMVTAYDGEGTIKGAKGTSRTTDGAADDYFSRPVHNTLGFPQSRIVITGPASLVRRLSSIRRYRSLKRKKFPPSNQPPRPLSPSTLNTKPSTLSTKPSSLKRQTSQPSISTSKSPVRIISPTPSAMARRRKSQKPKVRFEFNPMRGLQGSSTESPGWATEAMRKRSERRAAEKAARMDARAEKRRQKMKSVIGQPMLETVQE